MDNHKEEVEVEGKKERKRKTRLKKIWKNKK